MTNFTLAECRNCRHIREICLLRSCGACVDGASVLFTPLRLRELVKSSMNLCQVSKRACKRVTPALHVDTDALEY